MARGDRLSLLAIVTIFLVVIGTMHVGIQYSRGELFDHELASDLESDLRTAMWTRIDSERAELGRDPAQREANIRLEAQNTARQLQRMDYFGTDTAVGVPDGRSLPNEQPLCQQIPAKYTVTAEEWMPSGNVSEKTVQDVANRTAALFAREGLDVYRVPNDHRHGLGVAVDGNVVYVVYRYCNLGY